MKQLLLRLRAGIRAFFSWWFGELAAMLPARLVRWLRPTADRLELDLAEDSLVLGHVTKQSRREIGRLELKGMDAGKERTAIASLVKGLDPGRMVIALRLPQRQALRKMLDLPAAAEQNLRQVLTFEMDRQTPFTSDDVYFDFRVRKHDRETRRIGVEMIVLPRATVDVAVARARGWRLAPDAVDISVDGDDADAATPLNVLPETQGPRQGRFATGIGLVLGVVAVILLAEVIYLPLERQRLRAEALASDVAQAKEEAGTSRRLQEEIDRLIKQGRFIVEKKQQQPPFVEILNEVTRLLPDDTWLFRMRFFDGDVQTFGYSSAASSLIGTIEESDLFQNAQFRAPMTRDPRVDADRFHIAFQVVKASKS
jgi:general secretion pathway protein L